MKKMGIISQRNVNGGCVIECSCGAKYNNRVLHGMHVSWFPSHWCKTVRCDKAKKKDKTCWMVR